MSIKVELIQASMDAESDQKIITLVAEYPRAVHAHLLTHRIFSKNSSSTRAVPIQSAIQNIVDNPAKYLWTENQSGMQGSVIQDQSKLSTIESAVHKHFRDTVDFVTYLNQKEKEGGLNVHKQNAGRFLEPFQNIRVLITATEWDNWDWLRIDKDAQGEIEQLALAIKKVRDEADYMVLNKDEYHIPFITRKRKAFNISYHHPDTDEQLSLEDAITISLSICAQTSYRKEDSSLEKAKMIVDKLFMGDKKHLSPTEHIATPIPTFIDYRDYPESDWPVGVTHMDRKCIYWSGNFKNWIQLRHLRPEYKSL